MDLEALPCRALGLCVGQRERQRDDGVHLPKLDETRSIRQGEGPRSHSIQMGARAELVERAVSARKRWWRWPDVMTRATASAQMKKLSSWQIAAGQRLSLRSVESLLRDHQFLREELDAVQDASFDAILTIDEKGFIVAANEGASDMFLFSMDELIGIQVVNLMPPDQAELERKHIEQTGQTRVIVSLNRVRSVQGMRSTGEVFPFRLTVREIRRNEQSFYLCVANDLTSVDQAQRRILDLHTRLQTYSSALEVQVEHRTQQLESSMRAIAEANRRLALEVREREAIARDLQQREIQLERMLYKERELSELRSRFVSMASHEFRTPLTAMLSSIDVLEMSTPDPSSMFHKHVSRVRENIGYLRNVLEDFLQLGKLDVKGTDLHVQSVDLSQLMSTFIEDLSLVCKPGQEIVATISPDLGETLHSINGLRIVCTNLISNAIKYSPEGSVIYVTAVRKADGGLHIEVRDEGMGIPADELPHLFERFYRASNAETIKGTGLGLHICKQYIESMEGSIAVTKTAPGKGTTISVELPYRLRA